MGNKDFELFSFYFLLLLLLLPFPFPTLSLLTGESIRTTQGDLSLVYLQNKILIKLVYTDYVSLKLKKKNPPIFKITRFNWPEIYLIFIFHFMKICNLIFWSIRKNFFWNHQIFERNGKIGPFLSVVQIQTEYLKWLRICSLIYNW